MLLLCQERLSLPLPLFWQHYFLQECWFKDISLGDFGGAFTRSSHCPQSRGSTDCVSSLANGKCLGFPGQFWVSSLGFLFWFDLQRRPLTPPAAAGLVWWSLVRKWISLPNIAQCIWKGKIRWMIGNYTFLLCYRVWVHLIQNVPSKCFRAWVVSPLLVTIGKCRIQRA